ncbi:large ribosomal subunit protein uL10m-like [Tubulanus polymorphus]|uniref:large ribosomal subunit protein uL10m-like n=1 Tax=Tubulanus polymorphus TaxID=672921 RepID=UPI003DA5F552
MAASVCRRPSLLSHIYRQEITTIRYKSKINVQKPRPRHHERRVLEAVTRPIVIPEIMKLSETCSYGKQKELEVNLFEDFLVRRCQELFDNKMVLVLHAQAMSRIEYKKFNDSLMDHGINGVYYNTKVVLRTIANSKYENISPLILGFNYYVYSSEDKVKDLVKVLKKYPKFHILGGLLDDKLFTQEGLLRYAALPDLDAMRGQIVSILNTAAGGKTLQLMNSHQGTLSMSLDQYVKQSSQEDSSTGT